MAYFETLKKIAKQLQLLPEQTQLSIAVSANSDTQFYGWMRQDGTVTAIDNASSAFEIGSVTKAFTGNILAQLAIEKKIDLDAPVQQYLPFSLADNPFITCKQLALHTSGLPRLPQDLESVPGYDKSNPYKSYTEERLINYLSQPLQLDFPPGAQYQYSNLGAGLLGYLIAGVEGKSFDRVVRERIFAPLNMQHSGFDVREVHTEMVTALDENGNACPYWDGGILNGCVGIISTARDLSKFGIMATDPANGAAALQSQVAFEIEPGLKSNLGWGERIFQPGNIPVQGINGGTAGCGASVLVQRARNISIAVLSNISPVRYMEMIYPLNRELLMEMVRYPVS